MNSANYKEMMEELRNEYLESFDEKFDQMRGFLEGQDWYSLELEFHKLKGTGSTYGAPEVSELCQILESRCRTMGSLEEPTLESTITILSSIKAKYLQDKEYEMQTDPLYLGLKKL